MQTKILYAALFSLVVNVSCRNRNDQQEAKASISEAEPKKKETITKLEGDFFEPNHASHKIVFNGNTLCLYHGNDRKDEYKIYRGEVTIDKDSVNIFFRNEEHPEMNLKITSNGKDIIYLRGKGKDQNGRNINYNFVGAKL